MMWIPAFRGTGFRIPIIYLVSNAVVQSPKARFQIPQEKLPGFRISETKLYQITESGLRTAIIG